MAARKARHKKVFAGANALGMLNAISKPISSAKSWVGAKGRGRNLNKNVNPANKLFKSVSFAVTGLFVIGAITPANVYSHNSYYAPQLEGVADYYTAEDFVIADQDGYIPKINPQTELADRSTMNGRFVHEVESGQTISTIAEEYGLKTNTVLWENGLSSTSTLKIGQKLLIPPVDGVTHKVEKGQDIKKIASLYSVSEEAILKQNGLESSATLQADQALFVPGAKPLPVIIARNNPSRVGTNARVTGNVGSSVTVSGSEIGANNTSVVADGSMLYPTRGNLTQGFRAGHYAYDIADRSKPPIWATMGGTVEKASSGTWGGGYGNHIIINHGNGLKTLYGHLETLAVSVGDTVEQGQVIGKMGNTGNVRGVTGIHLHFEVIKNGVKQNPGNYF
ncbi:MAG: peptidoglycan DD-metalloendopeptidase family protein [Candidatus Altimarinota bacterium]